ncbi:quinoprotein relay system zinc metallohydrolase 1 [Marinobacter sp. S6332]|uniref:quinoprotein relay system zinc metallohydrolase 1 n=1 Tax=Marinobacter sp. S6332 TaxID=2926403 RepID=UPI001FF50A12|nr:quinoprotein relay system zinc metallohydrolase 1 [Marinobacter sp. S6332]MCK0165671.1 quinoprotein relay system zinc metallohydrolase 1 [Marinobacter sp. S6332]
MSRLRSFQGNIAWLVAAMLWVFAYSSGAGASTKSYDLEATLVADGVWVVAGTTDNFSKTNGGNILNTGFIETGEGVVVIDTGPSRRYGEEFRALIESHTSEPIVKVLITHHHPDHAFGSQAFEPDTLYMLDESARLLEQDGEAFSDNMYRMIGDWMRGTEVTVPMNRVQPGLLSLGTRQLRLISMQGHTGADLVVLDETSGVLFASDMVFFNRALTTPQTPGLALWRSEIRQLAQLPFSVVVPGHGPVIRDDRAFLQMIDYLTWLDDVLVGSAARGLSASEVIESAIPERFEEVEGARYELVRTVSHLYSDYEKHALRRH